MKRNPGDLFRAHQAKMQKASAPVRTSGSFQGKSNTLGSGGRAAQLKARGVPGGVIGNLARAAQAAPGQKNYHGGKKGKKRKDAPIVGRPASNVVGGSGGAYVRNYSGFTGGQASTIARGMQRGNIHGEPNKYGGEYIQDAPKASNPNSPANYGKAMNRAFASTKTFGVPGAKKAAIRKKGGTVVAPKSFGSKAQESYAKQFGIVPQSSTRTRTKRKGAGLKKEMAMAFKKRKSAKKKAMDCA